MLVFSIDTSTLHGAFGFAVVDETSSLQNVSSFAVCKAPAVPGHAETAIQRAQEVLKSGGFCLGDVDLFVFGRGPGTFTGVRIGLSTVKGSALVGNKPIIGISSLEATALSSGRQGRVAVLVDARRGELFASVYDVLWDAEGAPSTKDLSGEWVGKVDSVIERIANEYGTTLSFAVGSGLKPYREKIQSKLHTDLLGENYWTPCPFTMCKIGAARFLANGPDDLDSTEPVYLREPDAKLPSVALK